MYKEARLLSLYCESPVHAGSGNDLGVVDMPIQREKHTDYPIFQGSTLKGALRASFDSNMAISNALNNNNLFQSFSFNQDSLKEATKLVFGESNDSGNSGTSSISFSDARILLFPVKSAKNVFAWITSPTVLSRLKRDAEIAGFTVNWDVPKVKDGAMISSKSDLALNNGKNIILEEYTFDVENYNAENEDENKVDCIVEWIKNNFFSDSTDFWKNKLESDLVILNDNDFREFVTMSTEVVARTKIKNETKVVKDGALWYEENLPAESVLYSLVMATDILRTKEEKERLKSNNGLEDLEKAEEILSFFKEGLQDRIQLGGNETIGRGIIKAKLLEKGGKDSGQSSKKTK